MRLVTNASSLAADPDTAAWLFESAAISEASDPLNILLQREQEDEDDDVLQFLRTFN